MDTALVYPMAALVLPTAVVLARGGANRIPPRMAIYGASWIVLLAIALSGCSEPGKGVFPNPALNRVSPKAQQKAIEDMWRRSLCARAKTLEAELEEMLETYTERHPEVFLFRLEVESAAADCAVASDLPPGRWQYQNGTRVCDGYMTRFDNQDYCSGEPPEDWIPFSFDGQRYYIQPLSVPDRN